MRDWSIRGPVSLRDYSTGQTTDFSSAEEFVRSRLGRAVCGSIGDTSVLSKTGDTEDRFGFLLTYRYLLFDECGLIIPMWKVEELYRQYPREVWIPVRWRSGGRRVRYEYRRDPVPYTSCGWAGGHWYKHPRTMNEMRAAVALDSDDDAREYHIKPRRSRPNIPNAYWDMQRSDVRNRKSWKAHRKHQWRQRKNS